MRSTKKHRPRLDDKDPSGDSEFEAGETFDLAGPPRNHTEPGEAASVPDPGFFIDAARLEHFKRASACRPNPHVRYVAAPPLELDPTMGLARDTSFVAPGNFV